MLSGKIHEAMNRHLNKELYASYLYLSMSAYCESLNLPGCAHWMRIQSQEEYDHAMRFYQFVLDRGGRVILEGLDKPPIDFRSMLDVFEQALTHEQQVSKEIDELYGLTVDERDYPSQAFLQWFVTEQVEEEKVAGQIVATLNMVGDDKVALLMLDKELAGRRPDRADTTVGTPAG